MAILLIFDGLQVKACRVEEEKLEKIVEEKTAEDGAIVIDASNSGFVDGGVISFEIEDCEEEV